MDKQTERMIERERRIIITTSVTIASAIVSSPSPYHGDIISIATTTIDSMPNIGSDGGGGGGGGGGDGGGDSDCGGGDGGGGTTANITIVLLAFALSVDVAVPQYRCAVGGRGRCQMVKRKQIRERSDTHKG